MLINNLPDTGKMKNNDSNPVTLQKAIHRNDAENDA